jgi:hypothetical protein
MQFGRGMIQGISDQLFKQFAACVTERLETAHAGAETPAGAATQMPAEQRPINAIALVLGTIWNALAALTRRLFRRR